MTVPTEASQDKVERLAQMVRARGWSTLVVFLLQIAVPLGFLFSQAMTMLAPMLMPRGRGRVQYWAELLEDRAQLERLQHLIETTDAR